MRVHLVGSIGLDTVEDVFRTVGKELGPHLQRVPDGEIAGRNLWISWQYPLLRASAYLRPDPSGRVRPTNRFPLLTLAEGVAPADVHFGELGYAREARASYLDFVAARDKGELPKDVRFQVSLPTPFAVVSSVVLPEAESAVEAAYDKAMVAEVAALARHPPSRSLHSMGSVQRDGDLGRSKNRCGAVCRRPAREDHRASATAVHRNSRRCRAWLTLVLR